MRSLCDKSFIHAHHLKNHQSVHSKEKPFQCPLCNKPYKRTSIVTQHIKSKHSHQQRLPPLIINTRQDASLGPVICITLTFTNPIISNSDVTSNITNDVTVSRIVTPQETATVVTTELRHATITNVTLDLEEPPLQSIDFYSHFSS